MITNTKNLIFLEELKESTTESFTESTRILWIQKLKSSWNKLVRRAEQQKVLVNKLLSSKWCLGH